MTSHHVWKNDEGYASWASLNSTPDKQAFNLSASQNFPWSRKTQKVAGKEVTFRSYEMQTVSGSRTVENHSYKASTTFKPSESARSPITHPKKKRESILKTKTDTGSAHTVKINPPPIQHARVGEVKVGVATPLRAKSGSRMRTSYHRSTSSSSDDPRSNRNSTVDDTDNQVVHLTDAGPVDDEGQPPAVLVNTPVMLTLGAPLVPQHRGFANLPKQRSSITLNLGDEPLTIPRPAFERTYSYSSKTGQITPIEELTKSFEFPAPPKTSPDAEHKQQQHQQRLNVLFRSMSTPSRQPAPSPTRRRSYSAWKKDKMSQQRFRTTASLNPSNFWNEFDMLSRNVRALTDHTERKHYSDDEVFLELTPVKSRSAPQSPISSPPPSPSNKRRTRSYSLRRSQSVPRYLSSPDKRDYYRFCWQHIRGVEKEQEEEFW